MSFSVKYVDQLLVHYMGYFVVFKEEENNGDNEQRKDCRREETANDDDGHAGTRFRTGREGEGCRQHAYDHGEGCHEDRPQADAACFDNGLPWWQAPFHEGQGVIQEERAVLGDEAVHDQDTDEGIEV